MSSAESRAQRIHAALQYLATSTPDVLGCSLVSDDGLIIASALPAETDEDSIGGMTSVLHSLGMRVAMELDLGEVDQVLIRGKERNVLLVAAGDGAMLMTLMTRKAKLGLVFLDVKRTSAELATLI